MSEIRNETNYPIATQIDRGLFEIYNSPIYQRLYKANKFNYNIRKCDQNSAIQNIDPANMPELDFTFTPADLYMDMTQTSLNTVLDIPVPASFAAGDYIVQQNGNIYRAPEADWTNSSTWTDRMILPFYSTAIISKVKLYKDNKNGDSLQWEQDYINTYAENAKLGSQEQVNICQTNCQVNNDTRILLHVPTGSAIPKTFQVVIQIPFYGLCSALGVYPVFPFKNLNSNVKVSITYYTPAITNIITGVTVASGAIVKVNKVYFNIKTCDNPDLFKSLRDNKVNMYSLIQNYKYYKQTNLKPENEVVFQIQQAFASLDRIYIQNSQDGANANTIEKIEGYNILSGLHNVYKQPILPGDIKVIIDNENYFTQSPQTIQELMQINSNEGNLLNSLYSNSNKTFRIGDWQRFNNFLTIKLDDETSSAQSGTPSAGGNGIKIYAQSNMEIKYTLKDYRGINGLGPQNVSTLGYQQKNNTDGKTIEDDTSKEINTFTSECFCIYTQSMKIEDGDWQIVDGN